MTDNRTPEQRSDTMRAVKAKNTKPELVVRRALHAEGYRFRVHRKDLPGKPDLTFPGRRKVLFVHGCFWHAHGCRFGKPPKSNLDFWSPKLARNKARDKDSVRKLEKLGWHCLTVWQCEIRSDEEGVLKKIVDFLER